MEAPSASPSQTCYSQNSKCGDTPSQLDLDEIAKRLRLLGCTEEQVHRHLAPLLKVQSVSRSSVNRRSYSDVDEFTAFEPLATGRDDEGL